VASKLVKGTDFKTHSLLLGTAHQFLFIAYAEFNTPHRTLLSYKSLNINHSERSFFSRFSTALMGLDFPIVDVSIYTYN
jgi:hypothetical protein